MAADRLRPWQAVVPAVAVMAWGGNHFTPLLLMYRAVDGYSSLQVDLFLATYVLGLVPGFLLAGPLSDRHGRRPVTFVGLAASVLGSAILALGSTALVWMCVGRLVAGVGVAVGMVVGTSWIEELSRAPHDTGGDRTRGAKRASLALTFGFGAGAGVSGALAQWGPSPTLLPYAVHVALALAAAALLRRAPARARAPGAAVPGGSGWRALVGDLRIPAAARGRFVRVLLPSAPWVFSAGALAYVVLPALVGGHAGPNRIAFATLLTIVTLGAGAVVQPLVPRIAARTRGRQLVVGLGLSIVGTALCALEALWLSPAVAVGVAALLGLSYGIGLVAGLIEVQRMAGPDDLAGLTGIYCSLTYVGFALPVVLAALASLASYATLLAIVGLAGLGCWLSVARGLRRCGVVARRPAPQAA